MKNLQLNSGKITSIIKLPSSKSYANRVLILASIKKEPFLINHLPESSDVTWLINCLKQIGLSLEHNKNSLIISNSFPECEGQGCEIEVGEGGTTARFLASMILRGKKPYTLILGGRLSERPWQEFIDFVINFGGQARLEKDRLFIQGPLNLPALVEIDCSRTTQFASGIRLAFSDFPLNVRPVSMNSSASYWEMTEYLINYFQKNSSYTVPLDWSSASYPLAFGALNQEVFFPGLHYDSFQSDAKFKDILSGFLSLVERSDGILVSPIKSNHSVSFDVSDCLDLVPAISFFLAHVEGSHKLSGIKNLIHKESDRLSEIIKLLQIFGKTAKTDGESLFILGNHLKCNQSVKLVFPVDHRMVMTGALFLRHHGGGVLAPAEAVDKSYPGFFEVFT